MTFDIERKPWIEILIHLNSFDSLKEIEPFLELNLMEDQIKIDVTQTDNAEFIEILKNYKIKIPKYKKNINDVIVMEYDDGGSCVPYQNTYEQIFKNIQSKLINEDVLFACKYDFFIVDKNDPFFESNIIDNASSIEDVKKYVQIIFSNNDLYLYHPRHIMGLHVYYSIKIRKLFGQFQEPFSIIVFLGKTHEYVQRNMSSLYTRLMYICMSYEKAMYLCLGEINNDTSANLLYYLGYFIMLCTGAFDDIAWMLNNLYELQLHRKNISLKGKEFRKKLEEHNKQLFNLIMENASFYNKISQYYPIRDALQHRNFLTSGILHGLGETSHYIILDEEAYKKLFDKIKIKSQKRTDEKSIETTEYSVDPRILLEYLFKELFEIINEIYRTIDWNAYKKKLNADALIRVESTMAKYNEGIGSLWGFHGEPMYL